MLSTTSIIAAAVGLIQSLLFGSLLLLKKTKRLSDWVLLAWFLVFAIHLFLFLGLNEASKIHLLFAKCLGLLHGPLLLFYTRSVFNINFTRKDFLHLLPFLSFFFLGLVLQTNAKYVFDGTVVTTKIALLIVYPLYVMYWLANRLNFLKKTRADNFLLDTKWINTIAILLLVYSVVRTLHFLGDFVLDIHFSGFLDIAMYVTIMTIIGFYGLKFRIVYDAEPLEDFSGGNSDTGKKYKNSPLGRNEILQIKKRIDTYFEASQDYLNPDFSLSQLSDSLNVKKHHLSEVINLEMGTTFYDIINAKRVQHATQCMQNKSDSKITLEALGYESGFKTKSAFYHHFKHFTGKTPGQYKSQIRPN